MIDISTTKNDKYEPYYFTITINRIEVFNVDVDRIPTVCYMIDNL